jgi:hypothetical protein
MPLGLPTQVNSNNNSQAHQRIQAEQAARCIPAERASQCLQAERHYEMNPVRPLFPALAFTTHTPQHRFEWKSASSQLGVNALANESSRWRQRQCQAEAPTAIARP